MKRVCLIGNSQLVCWKHAWDEMQSEYGDDVSMTFFGASGSGVNELNPAGRSLVPGTKALRKSIENTSGGLGSIEIDSYTHFAIVGRNFCFRRICTLFLHFGVLRHLSSRPDIRLLSSACLEQGIDDRLRSAEALELHRKLSEMTPAPIFIATNPCLAEDAVWSGRPVFGKSYSVFSSVAKSDYMQDIYSIFEERAGRIAAEKKLRILMQEPSTMAFPGFTKSEYSRDGVGFSVRSSRTEDVSHMNKAYGAVCLKQLLRAMDSPVPA